MKRVFITFLIISNLILSNCKKDETSERFDFLTTPVWATDSLLANGMDASGEGGILEKFKGEAKFNMDGTGYFGIYKGIWELAYDDSQIIITTDSLPIPLTTQIVELNTLSLKITTGFPNVNNPLEPINIRMTFKSK